MVIPFAIEFADGTAFVAVEAPTIDEGAIIAAQIVAATRGTPTRIEMT